MLKLDPGNVGTAHPRRSTSGSSPSASAFSWRHWSTTPQVRPWHRHRRPPSGLLLQYRNRLYRLRFGLGQACWREGLAGWRSAITLGSADRRGHGVQVGDDGSNGAGGGAYGRRSFPELSTRGVSGQEGRGLLQIGDDPLLHHDAAGVDDLLSRADFVVAVLSGGGGRGEYGGRGDECSGDRRCECGWQLRGRVSFRETGNSKLS